MPEAGLDMEELYEFIADRFKQPDTAARYFNGILDTIDQLSYTGSSIAVSEREYLQHLYGPAARTVVYKKMTVIYNVIGPVVLIRRVMASSLIR
jgi:plasmid stabilization system protein ParE